MIEPPGVWPATIPAAAAHAALQWPDAPALIEADITWSFAALWADARAAAAACLAAGIGCGDRVAIWAPNGRGWMLAALGALSAGATIVPLNTRFKGREAADLLRRARVSVLFTVREFLGVDYGALLRGEDLPALRATILIDEIDGFIAQGRGAADALVDAALACLHGDMISDIIFTSGTTGAPKGALTAHRQVTHNFGDWARRVDLRQGDRYLIVNPFFHTFGFKAGWVACLLIGATAVPMAVFDVAETARRIERHRISFLPGPPTIYQSLLAEKALAEKAGFQHWDCACLRVAVTGAAPVAPVLVERMRAELGIATIVNGYGMTECGAISMTCQGDDAMTIATTCGTALPGLELRCVDDGGHDLPPGEAGEILVRGHAVMRGYLDDPAATALAIDPAGWLHTGDIGVLDRRGYLRITDRKKDMYISGGFNCYPAEIEKLLCAHPAVETSAVIGVDDTRMGEVGCAFVTLRPDQPGTEADIIAWARGAMANYKVPRRVVILAALPRNAGGKVAKLELRARLDADL